MCDFLAMGRNSPHGVAAQGDSGEVRSPAPVTSLLLVFVVTITLCV